MICGYFKVLDDIAANKPEMLFRMIAKLSDIRQGFQRGTFEEFSDAINYVAWRQDEQIGQNRSINMI